MERKLLASFFLPSIADILFLCILLKLLAGGMDLLRDGDTGWHIVTGENIISTLKVPHSDPYSHTMPGTPWTSHEWLSEVIFAALYRLAGLNGVVLFTIFVICATVFFLYRYMLRRGIDPLIAAPLTVMATAASTIHWLARPHILSLPLTLAVFVILELYQREDKNRLALLPLITLVWVNLHGGYMMGIFLILIYASGNLILYLFSDADKTAHLRKLKALWLTAAGTVIATFLNPHGPKILYFPFSLVGRRYIMDNISEWLSPNFHYNTTFEAMLVLYMAIFVLSKKKPDIFEGMTALLLLHMSLFSARYIPLMALVVTPMAGARAAEALDNLTSAANAGGLTARLRNRLKGISDNIKTFELRPALHLWVYAAVAFSLTLVLAGGKSSQASVFDFRHSDKVFPVDAVDFALRNKIQGNMYNTDSWGGYIIFKCYPRYRVFFDGRSDMYGVPMLKEYEKVARVKLGYEDVLNKYHITWVLYNANSPLCQTLAASGKWKLIYADSTADILLRDCPKNARLMRKFRKIAFVPTEGGGND
ncbi:MAG: hypothetical protein ABSG42_07935 [Nitrospirota bacterium]